MRHTVKTIDMPAFAIMLGAAKGAGFDTENILEQIVKVFLGGSAAEIPAQLITEISDVVTNYSKDPAGTAINTAVGAAVPMILLKAVGYGLAAFGLPKARTFGNIRIKWAL